LLNSELKSIVKLEIEDKHSSACLLLEVRYCALEYQNRNDLIQNENLQILENGLNLGSGWL